jgi:transcriptional regulator with XRE-family HTH domain
MEALKSASALRRARFEAGRTLLEIALATGISSTKLSAAERGLVRLTRGEQRVIAHALGIPSTDVFRLDGWVIRGSRA